MGTHNIPPCYRKIKEILIMSPDLALLSTLIGSNYSCLELIVMVPKVFEQLKFDCSYRNGSGQVRHILLGCKFEIAPADICRCNDAILPSVRRYFESQARWVVK